MTRYTVGWLFGAAVMLFAVGAIGFAQWLIPSTFTPWEFEWIAVFIIGGCFALLGVLAARRLEKKQIPNWARKAMNDTED